MLRGLRASSALGSPLRFAAAAAAVVTAASHAPLIKDHLEEAPYVGVLFLALCAVSVASALVLLRRDTRLVWVVTGLVQATAIVAFLWSRTFGLPQLGDDVGNWGEPLGFVALAAEGLFVVAALVALRQPRHARASRRRGWLAAGLAVLLTGVVGTGVATAAGSGAAHEHAAPVHDHGTPTDDHQMTATGDDAYWQQVGGAPFSGAGRVRQYYISADEVRWDYAPLRRNAITGKPFGAAENTFVEHVKGKRIGSVYTKCLYRAYTDASFRHRVKRPEPERYLGILGPVIRAEVGDTIKVQFRNTCGIKASMHPHGVLYGKGSEGAPYADGSTKAQQYDDAVKPGKQHAYVWKVPERAGPGPHDGSSVMWMYHSHTDEIGDTYAGLMGPMVITAQGQAKPDGTPKDVDHEVFELFAVMNENASPYLGGNAKDYADLLTTDPDDEDFEESNLMHSINGFVYGNQPVVSLRKGERVRWYVMGMGTEVDLHTPHWHGNDVVVGGMRMDVVSLLPAGMVVADMVPDSTGTWLFHCHVNDHITAGMMSTYEVA